MDLAARHRWTVAGTLALASLGLSGLAHAQGEMPAAPAADAPEEPTGEDPSAPGSPTDAPPSAPASPSQSPSAAPPPSTAPAPPDASTATAPSTPPPESDDAPPPRDDLLPPLDYYGPRATDGAPSDDGADRGFEMPPLSFRVDPFNWLLEGRFGIEAEAALFGFMTVELIPVFVVSDQPPTFNFAGAPKVLRQESNGIGPLSGAGVDVGFWLDGTPLRGYVIRVGITNESYAYRTEDDVGEIDALEHTERRAFALFGSHMRWGAFTIAGGIGLGMELNDEERCFAPNATSVGQVTTSGCKGQLLLATDRATLDPVDLNGGLHPMYLMGRFSLGVVLD